MITLPVLQQTSDMADRAECGESSQCIASSCPYCGVGCGVLAHVSATESGQQVRISGDPTHPANRGKLCIKGTHLADTLGMQHRVLTPMLGRQAQRQSSTWDVALEQIATQFQHCIDQYGRDSIAFYVSGQLLTEDYYVVNKLVKGYLGSANIDTNSRLCMSSAVAAHQRAFGEDIVSASYGDFEHTEMVVLVGSNTAWCHPVLYQRIMQAKAQRDIFLVVIDPRFTSTCEAADLHLPILPGQDTALFNGLLQYLAQYGHADQDFIDAHTQDLAQALAASQGEADLDGVAQRTGIALEKLQQFYQRFAQTQKVMTLFSMGVNQSSQGVNKANSIINCHLYSGKIGRLGAAAFSMTGQPNAMGGREVGGLANMLAAHLQLDQPEHRQLLQDFWQSPYMAERPGLKAVDLFQAVEQGQIKAIWIMATNPVVSLPNADQVKRALAKCPYVVVSDVCLDTDTTAYADVLLPALAWGEKEGSVTNSERYISRQRAFLTAPGQAKADWWAVAQVAQKLGFSGFDFANSYEIFLQHAQLSAYHNAELSKREQCRHFRYFNLAGLTALTQAQYQDLQPIQWPVWQANQADGTVAQLYHQGQFSHQDGKARFIATPALDPVHACDDDYPLILNSGRIRDQWHSMTRTGLSAALTAHQAVPYAEIHPQDALKFAIKDGALVQIGSAWGSCVLQAQLSTHIRRGQVFAPIHWQDQLASDARIGKVVNPAIDAISGEPEFKHTPVNVAPFYTEWRGLVVLHESGNPQLNDFISAQTWWVKINMQHAQCYELASRQPFAESCQQFKKLWSADEGIEWLNITDSSAEISHSVVLQHGRLLACLYIAPVDLLPDREWLASLFKRKRLSADHRKALLAGQSIHSTHAEGPLVCSCFKVGKNRIIQAIQSQQLETEQQVTACLKAGGNCGSCLPEIRGLIKACQ